MDCDLQSTLVRLCRAWVAVMLLLCSVTSHADDVFVEAVNPERSFGYTLGDVLERRVPLYTTQSSFTLTELPAPLRYGTWIELIQASVSSDNTWLVLQFQVINAPTSVIDTALPSQQFDTVQGTTLILPQWSFSVSPLIPQDTESGLTMQADKSPPAIDVSPLEDRLRWLVISLLLTLLVWLGWWLWQNSMDRKRLPFAHAYHRMKHGRLPCAQEDTPWLILHQAFDQTGGRVISVNTVNKLLETAPWLQPFSAPINTFYTASASRFFAQSTEAEDLSLIDFSKDLFLAEKRALSKTARPASADEPTA